MHFPTVLLGLLSTISFVSCSPAIIPKANLFPRRALQPLPLKSSDRWILDANGNKVPFVGINWPGAADVMIPEGLQYQSLKTIVSKIADTGFNVVRLTFAIQMVDDILDNGGDVSLCVALNRALGESNGAAVLAQILAKNPQFTKNTTRLQVCCFSKISLRQRACPGLRLV